MVHGVVTTQDKPVGRHFKLTPNPVKVLAQKHNINIQYSVSNIQFEPGAIGLVAAYGKIIPQEVLDKFNGQIYNIHPSLLPKYRGPSPLQQQILDDVKETGVTIIQLDAQMDHGPIVAQEKDIIRSDDTWITLGNRLFSLGTDLFLKFLLEPRTYHLEPQDHSQATYTKKLTRQDGFVEFEKFKNCLEFRNSDLEIKRKLKAFADWPGVWTLTPDGKRLKLISLDPSLVQPEGKSPIPYSVFHPTVV